MGFINIFNQVFNGHKQITQGFKSQRIFRNRPGAFLHQLEFILDLKLTRFGGVAKGMFQCNPDIMRCCETNNFSHGFFREKREKTVEDALVFEFPCLERKIGIGGTIGGGQRGLREGTIHNTEIALLAFKQGNQLTLPNQIFARVEFDSYHVDHGVEGEGVGHEGKKIYGIRLLIQRGS